MPTKRRAIGRRLREARLEAGLSVAEVARRIERTRQAVHAWEKGDALPELVLFGELARMYRTSTDAVLYGASPATGGTANVLVQIFGRHGAPDRTRASGCSG